MTPLQRTNWWTITLFAAIGFAIGYLTETAVSAAGNPPLVPPYSLPATLVVVSLILLGFAIGLRRSISGASQKRVNPFVAVRVVAAAKASILSGALFAGFGAAILLYFSLRTVPPQAESWWPVIVTVFAAIIQLVVGVISEFLCRVPPPSDEAGEQELATPPHTNTSESPGAVASHQHSRQHAHERERPGSPSRESSQ